MLPLNTVVPRRMALLFKVKTVTTKIKCEIQFLLSCHMELVAHMTRTDDRNDQNISIAADKLGPRCPIAAPWKKFGPSSLALAWAVTSAFPPTIRSPWPDQTSA